MKPTRLEARAFHALRVTAGIRQVDVAELAFAHVMHVSRFERGASVPDGVGERLPVALNVLAEVLPHD